MSEKKSSKDKKEEYRAIPLEARVGLFFENLNNPKQENEWFSYYTYDELQSLRVFIQNYQKAENRTYKLSGDDVKKFLEYLDKYKEENTKLFTVDELRPISWSKTVTLFDVYETDEESFTPYISPLATVGAVNTGNSSTDSIDTSGITTDESMGLTGDSASTGEKKEGMFGLGFFGL